MLSDKEKLEYKKEVAKLVEANALIEEVFHNTNHYLVRESVHEAMLPLNIAINLLNADLEG